MTRYLKARTAFFDSVVVGSLDAGVAQVVVGAAGYDGRALRYRMSGVRWIEVDHPDTQLDKRRRLARLGVDVSHVGFLAADFATDPLVAPLLDAGLERSSATLFLLEGIAVYLHRAVLESVLAQLRSVAGPGSRLAISLSVGGGSPVRAGHRAAFRAAVAALGEPVRSVIPPGEVDPLFAVAGWRVASPNEEQARGGGFVVAAPA
ncbi:MAG: class I SAM-dependent methyltransferase [Acidimicrobiia bacterium]|nr:class I SAM-dependent methyltransferase [Acidimicrobiia bacterium]